MLIMGCQNVMSNVGHVNICLFNPRLPKGRDGSLEDFFQAAKTLVSATKWLQLIVGSSSAVILVKTF